MNKYLSVIELILIVIIIYIILKSFNDIKDFFAKFFEGGAEKLGIKKRLPMDELTVMKNTFDKFKTPIRNWAKMYQVPPQRILSILYTETHGAENLTGLAGEVGVMQLSILADGAIPAYKKYVGDIQFDTQSVSSNGFKESESNIRVGCWYLSYLTFKYGDVNKATNKYNGNTVTYLDLVLQNENKFIQAGLVF